ncbi:MAG TPA: site-specific DNA-methyltransferase [Pyrinomonadaceae bacterium]|nr:site-specific DNA-methyltransferase [Pyrinomonadaceae bacterium]
MPTKPIKKRREQSGENQSEYENPSIDFGDAIKTMLNTPPIKTEKQKKASNVVELHSIDKWLNKVHCGDAVTVMNQMPEKSVGLVVTSPPYNLRNSTGNGLKNGNGGKWENAALLKGYETHTDDMPHDKYVEWQRECLTAMMRLLRDDGAIFYNHKWRVQNGLLQDRHDIIEGFPVRQIIIWKRNGGINFNPGYFLPTYEVIYLICKKDFKLAPKANAQGDVWYIPSENNNPHPAPFPVELAQRCISSTNAEIILDPFIGSGQTAIAAEALGRKWIGIDISVEYCKLAEERIKANRGLL